MGAGYHGGFGNTQSAISASATSIFVGKDPGDALKKNAENIPPESGFTDVVIHGTDQDVQILHNGKWIHLDQRRLSTMIKSDSGYNGGSIRLISCSTGKNASGFAQNLANKMGVSVMAPSDTLWVFPNGRMTIGPSQWKNTGSWITYRPIRKRG